MSMTMLLETNIFVSTIPYEKMRSWLSLFYDLFSGLKWQYIASCISATVGVHSRWPRYYQKFWLLVFPVSWLCFTPAFSTLPSKNILCSYVLYTHRCFSPLQLYYPLRLSPSLKTRRRRAVGVGGGRRCFMMFLFHFFLTEASGLWSDTNHYICMVLFCILNELKHFGICNDDLLLPDNNPILFPTLHCYLQKLLRFNIKVFWFLLFL